MVHVHQLMIILTMQTSSTRNANKFTKPKRRRLNDYVYKLFCGNVTDDDGNFGTSSSESELHNMYPTRGNGIMANNSGVEIDNVLIVNNYGSLGAGLFVLYHDHCLYNH